MLSNLNDVLPKALNEKYAIPAFNTYNLEVTQGIVEAAIIERSPVILAVSESSIKYAGLEIISQIIKYLASQSNIPIVLHLDHAHSIEIVKESLEAGFTSVMFDGSKLSLEKNINMTTQAIRLARQYNASCEGEIGTIGGQEDTTKNKVNLTDPNQALEFYEATGVDALAIALGTSHGLPVKNEHVDFDLLSKIHNQLQIPLVLHGASNLTYQTLNAAISKGIAKINIDTELRQAFTKGVREILKDKSIYDPRQYLTEARIEIKNTARKKIQILGSNNKI